MRPRLRLSLLLLASLPLLALSWVGVQLISARVHVTGLDGQVCPCELGDIRPCGEGEYRLHMPGAVGQVLYVVPESLRDNALAAEAYVLPWFGRQRCVVGAEGYADLKLR